MYSTPEATSATICEVRDQRFIPYYRLHPGRNKFCCRGHGVHSHEMCVFYVSFFLILGVTALFFAFEVRLLRIRLSPVVGVFGGILFIYVMATFLRTAFMDPGILPRATKAEAEWVRMSIATGEVQADGTGNSAGENTPAARTFTPGARTRQILIRGHHVKLNYCHSCKFFRPPRASHCSTCDNCVDRFDHHCPWVGNCVGRRNYRYFVLFIYSLSLYCVYILVFAIINLVFLYYENNDILEVVKASPGSLLEILITFFTMWTVFGLAGYHTSLSCREFSTHEDIRHFPRTLRQAGHENPFGRKNKCLNLSYVLCGPQPPSLLQAWRKVPEDSWPVGARGSVTDPSSMNETVVRMGGADNAYAVPVPLPIIGPDQGDQNWRDVPGGYPRQQHPQSNVVVESV